MKFIVPLLSLVLLTEQYISRRLVSGTPPPPTVVWTQLNQSGDTRTFNAQLAVRSMGVTNTIAYYGTKNSGIYSTGMYFGVIADGDIIFIELDDTGGTTSCNAMTYPNSNPGGWNDGDGAVEQPHPADRHPDVMNVIINEYWYQWSGLACNNEAAGDGIVYRDFWRKHLTADQEWENINPTTLPNVYFGAPLVYAAPYNALILHGNSGAAASGFPETWVYCFETSVLCAGVGDFELAYDGGSDSPPGSYFSNGEYVQSINKVLNFRVDGSTDPWTATVYQYDLEAETWSNRNPVNAPSIVLGQELPQQLWTLARTGDWAGNIFFHRTNNSASGSGQAADFMYKPVENVFIQLADTGNGPENLMFGVFVPNIGTNGGWVALGEGNVWWQGLFQ